jgi:hypothetical protein
MKDEEFSKMAEDQQKKWLPSLVNHQFSEADFGIIIAVELTQISIYKNEFEPYLGWSKLISFNKIAGKIINEFGGEISNWSNVGVVGYFDRKLVSPVLSVCAAIQIQRVFKQISNGSKEKLAQFMPKIVVSYGKIIKNVFGSFPIGDAVDIAVQFLRYTKPRQIIVHSKIKDVINENELKKLMGLDKAFGNRENREVEGVYESVDVNEVLWDGGELGVSELPQLIYKNIISKFDIDDVEGNVKSAVWICAPTIEFDLGILESIVDKNLRRGIKYRYMIPKGDALVRFRTLMGQWEQKNIDYKKLVECRLYDEGCILTTIAVYDPYEPKGEALVMLPSNRTLPLEEFPLVFDIKDRDGVDFYTRRLESLWEKKGCFTKYEEIA